jgi:uncharacterized protein (TIGR00369 family)
MNRTLQVTWQDPMLTAGAAKGRSGLAFLGAILDGAVPPPPIQQTLRFDLVHADEGVVRFRLVTGEQHANPMNVVHGGVACVLLDSAMGSAAMTTLDEQTAYTTVDLNVHLTRAIALDAGPIVAEGRVVHRGSRVITTAGELRDGRGRLLAHGTSTCLVMARG